MKRNDIFILIGVVIFSALVAGGVVYLWQQSLKSELEQKLIQAEREKNALQQQVGGIMQNPENTERFVKIISPNGGENFCLNGNLDIKWESKGVQTVGLDSYKYKANGYSHGTFGVYPATYNETGDSGKGEISFKIDGIKLDEGDSWKIRITSVDGGINLDDQSDAVFSIINCAG